MGEPLPEQGHRRWRVVVAVLLTLALALAAYVVHTSRTMAAVQVRTTVPDCEGTDLRRDGAIRARAGMRCLVGLRVSNESGRDVEVGQATLAYLGPGGGGVLRAGTAEGYPAQDGDGGGETDQVLVIGETLGGGQWFELRIPLLFRRSGCNGPGGTVTLEGFPTVELAYPGRTREVASSDDLVLTQVGPSRGCAVHD